MMGGRDPWSTPATVAGFVQSPPNAALLRFAAAERARGASCAIDIGCGAARNALPLARAGWRVLGTDTSVAMLQAAARRVATDAPAGRVLLVQSGMDALPAVDRTADLIIAHGIWNLARSGGELRAAVNEAARVARPGAGLFLFTFSRHTLPADATPVPGEAFVFTQFAGEPQCFLTLAEVIAEMQDAGFTPDEYVPLRELNRPSGPLQITSGPVIYEGSFRLSA